MKFLKHLLLEMPVKRGGKVYVYGEWFDSRGFGLTRIQGSIDRLLFDNILLLIIQREEHKLNNARDKIDNSAIDILMQDPEVEHIAKQLLRGKPQGAYAEEGLCGFGFTLTQAKLAYLQTQEDMLGESLVTKHQLKKEEQKKIVASKAADLKPYLDKIKVEKDFEKAKALAIEMADHFEVGKKEQFKKGVAGAKSLTALQFHCYNTALKGEGKGSKLY